MNVGQPEVTTAVVIGQFFVIEAKQVQHCGMQIMNVHPVLDCMVAKLVRCAVNETRLYTAPRHPHRVPVRIMVAAIVFLRVRGATEFTTPKNQRIL